jgi:arginyl-tRNA synthetase
VRDRLLAELRRVARALGAPDVTFVLERPRDPLHGDLATNLALALAGPLGATPRAIAERIVAELRLSPDLVTGVEIAGPGFINIRLASSQLAAGVRRILNEGQAFGRSEVGRGIRVNVEFVSANPTGPLHVGHGRGAALGDAVSSLLEWTGHEVTREFYINDAGAQIDKLAQSLWARVQQAAGAWQDVPEGGYHGEYLKEMAARILEDRGEAFARLPEADGLTRCREIAVEAQRSEQDQLLGDFRVHFDVLTSETALYDRGKVGHGLEVLAARDLTYEADGALWLRTRAHGDDKDRVLRKQDGSFTYLVPDIAYHIDKRERGFDRVINVWGADHHGYIPRMRSVLAALGYPPDFFAVLLVQLVKVVKGGEEVRMSKRAGDFVTLRDLLDDVGVDAARYFFLMRRGDTPFIFDVDLAVRQTEENPVFYVQMAHARMSGIFRVAGVAPDTAGLDFDPTALPAEEDAALARLLPLFPDIVDRAAREREPHRVTAYLEDLARVAHAWYHRCRVLGEPPAIERNRLALAGAARTVLANGLAVLGLTAPDRM